MKTFFKAFASDEKKIYKHVSNKKNGIRLMARLKSLLHKKKLQKHLKETGALEKLLRNT